MAWLLTLLTFVAVVSGLVSVFALLADLGADRARLNIRLDETFGTPREAEQGPLLVKDLGRLAAEVQAGAPDAGAWGRLELWLQQSGLGGSRAAC